MSRYNHFAKNKYREILFSDIPVGEKFRLDTFKNSRRRADIVMIKTGDLSYMEAVSKKESRVFHTNNFYVQEYMLMETKADQ